MKLSIIVPVYNMASDGKVNYCIDSLLNQTLQDDYEIIAVDDCSSDDSFSVLKGYEEQYPGKVVALKTPVNKKQGGARNLGMEHAKGEWIGFMDGDDWAHPTMYEKLLKKAEDTGADVVGCQYHFTDEHSLKIGKVMVNNTMDQCGSLTEEQYGKLIRKCGSMVIKIYRHDVIIDKKLHFPENMFYEDNAAGPLWMLSFKHFELVDEPLYYYYQHDTSTVHTVTKERCENRMKAAELFLSWMKEYGYYETYRLEIEAQFTVIFYVNTLFSYVQATKHPDPKFVQEIRDRMRGYFPDFLNNPYVQELYDAEQKKLMRMHMEHPRRYITYAKLLQNYRRIRYGK